MYANELKNKDSLTSAETRILSNINSLKDLNFTYKEYNSWQDISNYVASDSYATDADHPYVCFGFAIIMNSASDFEVRLLFNDRKDQQKD